MSLDGPSANHVYGNNNDINFVMHLFSKHNGRHSELFNKHKVGLNTFLQQGIPRTSFYGVLIYKFNELWQTYFPCQFGKMMSSGVIKKKKHILDSKKAHGFSTCFRHTEQKQS